MEAGDALRGCGIGPRIPLLLMIGWRGYPGAMEGRLPIDSAYPYTEPILDAWGVPHRHLMSDDDLGVIGEMAATAEETSLPVAVVYGYGFTA
jgi:sulfopyruvate decarboxylase TPP-binding subunit